MKLFIDKKNLLKALTIVLLFCFNYSSNAHNKVVVIPMEGEKGDDVIVYVPVPPPYPALVEKTGQTATYGLYDDGHFEAGVTWPASRFTDHGNGTVTDELTGLMWLKDLNCADGTRDWDEARNDAQELNTSGTMNGKICDDAPNDIIPYSGWRLPNIKELQSIMDYSQIVPPSVFSGNPGVEHYWASTSFAGNTNQKLLINISYGLITLDHFSTGTSYFGWAVRAGE